MTQKLLFILTICFSISISTHAQALKKPLNHDVYEGWNRLQRSGISHSGNWIYYEKNPQIGDGELQVKHSFEEDAFVIPRAYQAAMDVGEQFLVGKIKAPYDSTRKAKLAKKKGDALPQDSLVVQMLEGENRLKYADVKSFQVAPGVEGNASNWIVFQLAKTPQAPQDTTASDSSMQEKPEKPEKRSDRKKGKKKSKKKNFPAVLMNPISGDSLWVKSVSSYQISPDGRFIGLIVDTGDSVDQVEVRIFTTEQQTFRTIYEGMGHAKSLTFDKKGEQLAFLATTDTGKVKIYHLRGWKAGEEKAEKWVHQATDGMPEGWSVSEHSRLTFSESGNRLFLGTAPNPEPVPEDTLIEDEKTRLDIWTWHDKRLQPQQLKELERDKKANYMGVLEIEKGNYRQLGDELMSTVMTTNKGDGQWAAGYARMPYYKSSSWDFPRKQDVYLINTVTGERQLILENFQSAARISPLGNYLLYYDYETDGWLAYSTETQKTVQLTQKLKVNFYDEKHDSPHEARPYGLSGWTEGDEFVLIKDRFDIWKIDPSGKKKAYNLTQREGRKNNIRFDYVRLDREELFVNPNMLLRGFNEETKEDGYYHLELNGKSDPDVLMVTDHSYRRPQKAEAADRLIWQRETFSEYPNLWISALDFTEARQISDINPQQSEYLWGTVELVYWTAYNGKKLEGLLYKPENFDPSKKYPMISYFYERSSNRLHSYSMPQPSRSIIYPSYYASNGYVIFIPNIEYTTGQPGEDAYNAVVSGTEYLVDKYEWLDKDRLALQGQSWGGYQVAYIVTKTDMYAAAMAGAPVSNMTSAYGGIRWGSGMSRMFQYERTQSRLGVSLWEDTDRYLANSPLFSAPNISTPLLMMHNDADGAVPWYQGIEFFVALRRLNKPVWMLVYNGEAHNLTRWPNRVDLSIRMQQFFDHYLKDAPAPAWMVKGVPAIEKGQNLGYELINKSQR